MLVTLTILVIIILVIAWWYSSNRRREIALRHATRFCKQNKVQLLDQSVQCHRLRLCRDEGHIAIKTTYRFEYAAQSTDRQYCHMILIGHSLQWIGALKTDIDASTPRSDANVTPKKEVIDFSHYKKLKSKNDENKH